MPTLDSVIKQLPPETQQVIRAVWDSVPTSQRGDLTALLRYLPNETNMMRLLLSLGSTQLKQTFGSKHRVVVVGPANVGKSTLYNQLIQSKEDKAAVSPVAGTTRENQQADAGLFQIVDTPGADAVGEVGERERELAFMAALDADLIVIIFDAIQGVKRTEQEMYRQLVALDKSYVVVLNKIDLVRKDKEAVVQQAATALNLDPEQIIPIAARSGENIPHLVMAIAVAEPALVSALGHALPRYRWQLAWRTTASAASVAAAIALTPLPIIDFAPLVITQSVMVLGIARIYDYKITLERARELVVTFGLGMLGRTLFGELSKFGGVPGWLLSSAIAAATTTAMGVAAAAWFERGERLSHESLNQLTRQLTGDLVSSLRGLGKGRRPSKDMLREAVEKTLQEKQAPLPPTDVPPAVPPSLPPTSTPSDPSAPEPPEKLPPTQ